MVNLRERVEQDLFRSLESEWGLPVILIDPDGATINTSENSPDPTAPLDLVGQILYDTVLTSPDTGEQIVVNHPVVTLRRSSLPRVPAAGENWLIKIPVDPSESASTEDFIIDPTRPPEGGRSIGFIRLYLRKAVQK